MKTIPTIPTQVEFDSDIVKAILKIALSYCKNKGYFNPPSQSDVYVTLTALLLFAHEVENGKMSSPK